MVRLTDKEKRMLEGDLGEFRGKAMEFIVRYADVLGAEELVEVSRATLFIGAQRYLDCYDPATDYGKIFSEFYLCSEKALDFARFAEGCKTQTCAGACDFAEYRRSHVSKELIDRNWSYLQATKECGVKIVESCTPYYVGWIPIMGEHFVSTESSNVVISNSVFGAMGNSDGVEAAVCAAITGRTPKWGMHVRSGRRATCLVNVECRLETAFDWDLLGFTIGRLMPKHVVPVVAGDFPKPDIDRLKQFASSIAVTSSTELCHIVGVTPEAHTLEMATDGRKPPCEITVSREDCVESFEMICDKGSGPVDYVSIGCPHLSLDELKGVAESLRGKRIRPGGELLVWTDYATKSMSDLNGYTRTIEDSGACVLTGSCPVVMREDCHRHATGMAINGAKQAFNIKNQTGVPVYFGDIRECLNAALLGKWEKRTWKKS